MVKLRLARIGRKNIPVFKVVAQDARCDTAGRIIEALGFYNPRTKQKKINAEKVKFWIKKGAQISDSLYNLLVSEKIIKGKKRNVYHIKKKTASENAPAPESAEESKK